ncbi:glutathione S-transferase N-terminal domain-containing protein, partial [Guyparkeria sp. 1SP6A2]|nr:glutathione S-transferase N-terminal domain-containing protein [Guyparkeria sp. 1SP6A2]
MRLLLALTGRACEIVDVEESSEALAKAKAAGVLPFGKAPALHLDDGRVLAESNAILCWLAEGT